jgi:PAS domain S-box-containing protein
MVDRFQHLFDSLKEPVVVVDQDLGVTYANPAWLRFVGLSPSRALNQNCYELLLHSENPSLAEAYAPEQVFKTGQPLSLDCPDHIMKEGRRCCTVSASPVFDGAGLVSEVILIYFFEPEVPGRDKELDSPPSEEDVRLGDFDENDLTVAQSMAEQLDIGLENARLFAAEAQRRREAETLQAATQALSSTLDLQSVFEAILRELQKVVPYDSSSVQRLEGDKLEIIGGHGFPNLEELLGLSFSLEATDNPNRKVIESRTPLVLDDAPGWASHCSLEIG